ncbi:MAG TPA: response regulator [Opitutaceae bacterium]|nr:response regulator [Opitutaceae bacterium]
MNDKIILLVEDNPDDAVLTLDAVEQSELRGRVVVVDDGAAALEYLYRTGAYADRDPRYDAAVMLLDLKLPKVDGLEVLRRTRADPRTRTLPVIVLTSSREIRDLVASYELGANSYIRKPVDFDQFIEVVRHVGNYWLRLNEVPPSAFVP